MIEIDFKVRSSGMVRLGIYLRNYELLWFSTASFPDRFGEARLDLFNELITLATYDI